MAICFYWHWRLVILRFDLYLLHDAGCTGCKHAIEQLTETVNSQEKEITELKEKLHWMEKQKVIKYSLLLLTLIDYFVKVICIKYNNYLKRIFKMLYF